MFDVIPISRVFITYKPSSVAINQITYSGIILGESKDLHFLANTEFDDGHFVPQDSDTNLNRSYDGTSSDTITVSLSEYPNLKSNYTVDYASTALYATNTKYLPMYRSSSTNTTATFPVYVVPLSQTTAVLATKDVTDTSSVTTEAFTTTGPGHEFPVNSGLYYDAVSNTIKVTRALPTDTLIVPGTFRVDLRIDDGSAPKRYIIADRDLRTSGGTGDVFDKVLYVYEDDGSGDIIEISGMTDAVGTVPYTGGTVSATITLPTGYYPTNATYAQVGLSSSDIIVKSNDKHGVLLGALSGDIILATDVYDSISYSSGMSTADMSVYTLDSALDAGDGDFLSAARSAVIASTTPTYVTAGGRKVRVGHIASVSDSGKITFSEPLFASLDDTHSIGLTPRRQFAIVYLETASNPRHLLTKVETSGLNEGDVTLSIDGTADTTQDAYVDTTITRGFAAGGSIPLTTAVTPSNYLAGKDGLFLHADLYLSYIAENHDPTLLNNILTLDDNYESVIGYPDPRNPLGFTYRRVKDMIGDRQLFVMPIDTSTDEGISAGLGVLSNYLDIFQVLLLVDDYKGVFDTWLQDESDPDNSRFRIGFNPTKIITSVTMYDEQEFVGQLSLDGTNHYRLVTSTPEIDFSTTLQPGAIVTLTELGSTTPMSTTFTVGSDIGVNYVTFLETATSFPTTTVHTISASKLLSTQEIVDTMYDAQTSNTDYLYKVIGGEFDYTYNHAQTGKPVTIKLPNMYNGILAFGPSISTPPHQPLTSLVVSGYGYGRVYGTAGLFSRDQFSKLVSAGYYTLTSTIGAAPEPFCLRDVNCGFKQGTSLNGTLPKSKPVLLYAKDIYFITKQFLGKNNVVDDVINEIQLRLDALRRRNLSRYYKHLGTVLARASKPEITIVPNGIVIKYTVAPQDQMETIDNYVTVVDKVAATEG